MNCYEAAFEVDPSLFDLDALALVEPVIPDSGDLVLPVEHRSVTYRAMFENIERLAGALADRGVQPGDRILMMVPMSIALYQTMLAAFKCGAVCLFIDPADGLPQLDRTAARLEPKAFIGTPKAQLLRRVCPSLGKIPLAFTTDVTDGETRSLEDLIVRGPTRFRTVPRKLDDPALISFTSGSSGIPKGVRRTHGDLRVQFRAMSQHEGKRMKGVNFCAFPVLPIDDVSAGRTCVLAAVRPGQSTQADAAALLDQIRQFPPVLMSVPPNVLERVVVAATPGQLDTVKHVYTGGGPVPLSALRRAEEVMPLAAVNMVYGSTEAEPVAMITAKTVLSETAAATQAGQGACVGRLAPGLNVMIAEPVDGPIEKLKLVREGEILVAAPHVNRAYFENPEETRRHKLQLPGAPQVWHRMGDLGYRDDQGRLWITGRLANRVVTPHVTLDTGRVEPRFVAIPGIRRAALIGIPVVQNGAPLTEAAVLVELADDADRPEAMRAARELAASLTIPWVQVVYRIPLDRRIGAKIQYGELIDRFGPLIRQALSDPFSGRLSEYLAERFPPPVAGVAALLLTVGVAAMAVQPWYGSLLRVAAVAGATFLFLFHLRVYDEQKDGARDRITHPDRVLSRGIVTVGELTALDRQGLLIQAVLAMLLGLKPFAWWLAAVGWAWLMRREFFVGEWLRARIVLYGLSHSLVVFWLVQFIVAGVGGAPLAISLGLMAAALSWFQEVARKLDPAGARARRDTRDSDESYLRELGVLRTGALLAGLQLVVLGLAIQLATRARAGVGLAIAVSIAVSLGMLATGGFITRPTRKAGKSVQGASLLLGLVVYTALAFRPLWGSQAAAGQDSAGLGLRRSTSADGSAAARPALRAGSGQ